jgi:hypothetical protein
MELIGCHGNSELRTFQERKEVQLKPVEITASWPRSGPREERWRSGSGVLVQSSEGRPFSQRLLPRWLVDHGRLFGNAYALSGLGVAARALSYSDCYRWPSHRVQLFLKERKQGQASQKVET